MNGHHKPSTLPLQRIIIRVTVEIYRKEYGEKEDRILGVLPTEEHRDRLLDPCILHPKMKDKGMVIEQVEPNVDETKLDLLVSAKGDTTREYILHSIGLLKLEFSIATEIFLGIVFKLEEE